MTNAILSIAKTEKEYNFDGDISIATHNEHLVYAIIKACSEEEARTKAIKIISWFVKEQDFY